MEARAYLEALPLHRTRELHVSGVGRFTGKPLEAARELPAISELTERLAGKRIDHLPLTEADWELTAWILARLAEAGEVELVTLEAGGVGPLFRVLTEEAVLAEEIPRLTRLLAPYRQA